MTKATNQLHGKKIEDLIKNTFQGSADSFREITAKFDIEAKFDKERNLDTSIKASKSLIIEMADARRFFSNQEPFRLLVCRYKQTGKKKEFYEINEIFLTQEILTEIKGNIPYLEVEKFHNSLKDFPIGKHKEARAFAQDRKKELLEKFKSSIILNPKIDSKNQRRLQCSLNLNEIYEKHPNSYIIHKEDYKNLVLPISIISETRKFNKEKQ